MVQTTTRTRNTKENQGAKMKRKGSVILLCFFLFGLMGTTIMFLVAATTESVQMQVACVDGNGFVIKNLPTDITCIQEPQSFGKWGAFQPIGIMLTIGLAFFTAISFMALIASFFMEAS